MANFLINRSIRVKTQNTLSNQHYNEKGLPQGSALSITLFLVAINDIDKHLPFSVKHKLFADDCNIYYRGTQLLTTQLATVTPYTKTVLLRTIQFITIN